MSITIAVADDHAVVREGVVRILQEIPGLAVVASVASGDELADLLVRGARPTVALVDVHMPGGGVDLVARLHELQPGLRILVFSMHPEQGHAARCLAAGASGHLAKGCPPAELVESIRTVARNG